MLPAIITVAALLVSFLGVGKMRGWAAERGLLAVPGERSSHRVATPTGGGAVIAVVAIAGVVCAWLLRPDWARPGLPAFLIVAFLVAVVGWLDDMYTLPAGLRFGVQAVAALVIILRVGAFESIALFELGDLPLGWIGFPLTFLWVVGLINAFNFMDGIDGNAGGIGAAAGAMWALVAWRLDQPLLTTLGLLLSAACLGFLGHNWQPARIFMGDVGSTFLGVTFAAMPLLALQGSGDARLPVVGALLLAPCIWDAAFTFLRRIFQGEPPFQAHRTYLYQRLASSGYPHRVGAGFYLLLTLATGLCGWLYLTAGGRWGWQLLVLVVFVLAVQVAVVRFAERGRPA
ncbi:MAG: glycosyltransferase family 4 protein [Anaerolineales bacterium]|jgi:UDP-N-acetylmuramyl pentapeptide phosphotransferase/UDP-N-acetylglucosamine-1-phosphate transferase|nr:glycosyl transferase family 4 [Anaerolineaceae bacterium]MDP7345693.1 glycosyltransferase family 4 protein [Anaerolineales bacterium]MDP7644101.1 glycosyltransferase family 4 protein [Anaerolineales bacterium]HJN42231.1 glycosyltransferase family 4 protein [Anaerolineales bacterium]|tara:strand:- start:1457 stop:2488 length:1032 start_codon:yes stop_codon:yes gene_type:complete